MIGSNICEFHLTEQWPKRRLIICHISYVTKIPLAGIIYLHRISDNRMAGSLVDTLGLFSKLCGMSVMGNVIIATSMWDEVNEKRGPQREQELIESFFKDMVANGCAVKRFEKTRESAWAIVDIILGKKPCHTLTLQDETGRQGLEISKTGAGQKAKATGFRGMIQKFSGLFSRKQLN